MISPLVSVIIPAYNHEKYVQETIKSIIDQTYQNIELLIVDDGSKDSTWQKIQESENECRKRFVNIHFETKKNEGVCKTLNRLLSLAKGEYVYLIASDDLAKPDAIKKEAEFLNNNPGYTLAVGNNDIIDSESRVCYWNKKREIVYDIKKAKSKTFVEYLKRHNNFFNEKDFGKYSTIFRGNYIPNGYLLRKSIFNKIGFFPEQNITEDYWLMMQISKYSKMKYIDEVLFSYRWHNSNTIKNVEKIKTMGYNTLALEVDIQNNLDRNSVNKDVLDTIDNGAIDKKTGIPFLFEIVSRKKATYKIKSVYLFNIKIFECRKNY